MSVKRGIERSCRSKEKTRIRNEKGDEEDKELGEWSGVRVEWKA